MKSIKEKAEEFHEVIKVINEHESIVNTQGSKMFVEGANYVLDAIKNVLSHPLKYVHSDKSVEEGMITDIVNIVKQLESNQ